MGWGDQPGRGVGNEVVFKFIYTQHTFTYFEQLSHDDPDHLAQEAVGRDAETEFVAVWIYQQVCSHHITDGMFVFIRAGAKRLVILVFWQDRGCLFHFVKIQVPEEVIGTQSV